jgi:endonuclease/exonuclease/phosphatase family metal-dependent hydrolase
VAELQLLARMIESKRKNKHTVDKDIILTGDFNIPRIGDKYYKAITKHGLAMPRAFQSVRENKLCSNLARDKRYDQILHYPGATGSVFTGKGGVVDFYAGDHQALFKGMNRLSLYQFTCQLSDHLPLWINIDIDTSDEELDQIINPRSKASTKRKKRTKGRKRR